MKKLFALFAGISITMIAHAGIIAYDDFSGGTPGTSIYGSTDDYGHTWENIGGVLNDAYYGNGCYVVSPSGQNGAAGIAGDFSKAGIGADIIKISVDITPKGHAALSSAKLTVGFFSDIDKGLIVNTTPTAGDALFFELQFQNANLPNNEGNGFPVVQSGGKRGKNGWLNMAVPPPIELGSDRTIRLTLQYNYATGAVVIQNSFADTGELISSKEFTADPGLSFKYAAFGWNMGNDVTVTDPSRVTNFKIETVQN